MQTIKDLLNKIKWDKRESPEDYSIIYIDLGKPKEMKYSDIKELEGNFMLVIKEGKEIEIPLHRIRQVKKKGEVIWKRG